MENNLTENDFCVYKSGKNVKALGWNINSEMLKNDIPIASYNIQAGGNKSKEGGALIENLAIPAGLILLKNAIESNIGINNMVGESKVIEEDLYDKLLKLSGQKRRIHKTRSKKRRYKNKTKKNR